MSPSALPSGEEFTCPGRSILSNQFRQIISPSPFPLSSSSPSQSQLSSITPSQSQLPTATPSESQLLTTAPFQPQQFTSTPTSTPIGILPPGVPRPKLEILPPKSLLPRPSGTSLSFSPPNELVFPFFDFAYQLQGTLSSSREFQSRCTEGKLTYTSARSSTRLSVSSHQTRFITSYFLEGCRLHTLNITSVVRGRTLLPTGIQMRLIFMKGNFRMFVRQKLKETLKQGEFINMFRFTRTKIKKTKGGTIFLVFARYSKAFVNSLPT